MRTTRTVLCSTVTRRGLGLLNGLRRSPLQINPTFHICRRGFESQASPMRMEMKMLAFLHTCLLVLYFPLNFLYYPLFVQSLLTCKSMEHCTCYEQHVPVFHDTFPSLEEKKKFRLAKVLDCVRLGLIKVPDFGVKDKLDIDTILLNGNSIKSVDKYAFGNITVNKIDMADNPLHTIDRYAFLHMKDKLETLILSGTKIQIGESLHFLNGLSNLKELDISRILLEVNVLPLDFINLYGLYSLKRLVISGLKLKDIAPGTFLGLESITSLGMGSNDFVSIPKEVKRLTNLKYLSVTGCRHITITRNALQGFKLLEFLELFNLGLHYFPGYAIQDLDNLKKLDVSYNNIQELNNDSFPGVYRLKTMMLSGNPLRFHDTMFGRLEESLDEIDISNMALTTLPLGSLQRLKRLKLLSAGFNMFNIIDEDFLDGLSLKHLDINNMITLEHVSPRAFHNMMAPFDLDIRGTGVRSLSFLLAARPLFYGKVDANFNPLECDCALWKLFLDRPVNGPLFGTCTFPNDTENSYVFVIYANMAEDLSKRGDLGARLTSNCELSEAKYRGVVNASATLHKLLARLNIVLFISLVYRNVITLI
ncbi:hypothetical protein CHS0354_029351 [Potamilus streckersoni]|uniref:Insulin-like growth factor-binding protein complex acid labile subunit n=1 Tax=Potamilus streckersoni TaxID=2493646 RepID=A0AAE0SY25_9BIVA|nr:hypothetical protein CHS0354_029351 [Potamilus streckersoni]